MGVFLRTQNILQLLFYIFIGWYEHITLYFHIDKHKREHKQEKKMYSLWVKEVREKTFDWGQMKRKRHSIEVKDGEKEERRRGWTRRRDGEQTQPPVYAATEVGKVFCGQCNYSENVRDGGRGSLTAECERESHALVLCVSYDMLLSVCLCNQQCSCT